MPDPANRIATATVDLPPDWAEQVTDFPGRGARRYELRWRVDDGTERTFRTGEIRGCTEIEFEIAAGGAVDIAERARTICYGQDD